MRVTVVSGSEGYFEDQRESHADKALGMVPGTGERVVSGLSQCL